MTRRHIIHRTLAALIPLVLVAASTASATQVNDHRLTADGTTTPGFRVRIGLRVGPQEPAASKARMSLSIRDSHDNLVGRLIAFTGRSDARVHVVLYDRAQRQLRRGDGRLPVTISASVRGHAVSPLRITLRAP